MEHEYEKLMQEKGLTLDKLPLDAKIGIRTIADIEKSINMMEKTGRKVSEKVLQKLKANDKWVVREIKDELEGKDTNSAKLPHETKEVVEEIKQEAAVEPVIVGANQTEDAVDTKGIAIDKELATQLEAGKTKFTIDELKSSSPTSYKVVFETYEEGKENGIETTYHKLIETEKQVYTLTKK